MDVIKELQEVEKLWGNRTLIGKLFLLFALFLTFASVGSLADSVFKFKGFLADGLSFYNEITTPARQFLSEIFHLKISKTKQDAFVIICMYAGILLRIPIYFDQREGVYGILSILLAILSTVGSSFVFVYLFGPQLGLILVFPMIPFIHELTLSKEFKLTKVSRLIFLCILMIYFIIACIAAISSGLAKPLAS